MDRMQEWLAKLRSTAKWQGTSAADKALADVRHELEQLHPDELELLVRHAKGSGTKFLASYIRTWDARLDDARRRYGTRPQAVRVVAATVAAPAAGPGAAPAAASIRDLRQSFNARLPRIMDERGRPLPWADRARREAVEIARSAIYDATEAADMETALAVFRAEWSRIDSMMPAELAALNAALEARAEAESSEFRAMLAALEVVVDEARAEAESLPMSAWNEVSATTIAA